MEVIKLTQKQWMSEDTRVVNDGLHRISYGVLESPVAIVFRKTEVDEEVCKECGCEVVESFCNGGTIVTNKGDMLMGHFYTIENGWRNKFVEYFVNWLKSKGLNAEYVDNDILVDDYKVCGTCITRHGCIDYTSVFVGINTNLDHIKKICTKPMKKIPKGLSEYGITTEEVEEMFLNFCKGE